MQLFKKPRHFIGMRMIKTVLAVMTCFLIGFFRGTTPFYSAIAAILCMQPSVEHAAKAAVTRTVGTLVGGAFGVGMLYLASWAGLEPLSLGYDVVVALLLVPLMYLTLWLKQPGGTYITCVVFLSIVLARITSGAPYLFALERMMETLIGIFISLAVNWLLPGGKAEPEEVQKS